MSRTTTALMLRAWRHIDACEEHRGCGSSWYCWSCPPFSVSSPSLNMLGEDSHPGGRAEVGYCCWGKWVQSSAPSLGFRVLLAAISLPLPSISCVCLHLTLSFLPTCAQTHSQITSPLCLRWLVPSHMDRGEKGVTLQRLALLRAPLGAQGPVAGRAVGQQIAPDGRRLSPPAPKHAENQESSQWLSWLTRRETAPAWRTRLQEEQGIGAGRDQRADVG